MKSDCPYKSTNETVLNMQEYVKKVTQFQFSNTGPLPCEFREQGISEKLYHAPKTTVIHFGLL